MKSDFAEKFQKFVQSFAQKCSKTSICFLFLYYLTKNRFELALSILVFFEDLRDINSKN